MKQKDFFLSNILFVFLVLTFMIGSSPAAAQQTGDVPARSEINEEDTWDVSDLYESDPKWEESFAKTEGMLEEYTKYKGNIHKSGRTLLECLELDVEVGTVMGRLFSYARRKRDEEIGNTTYQAMADRIQGLGTKGSNASAFIQPEILAIDDRTLENFLKTTKGFDLYEHYLNDLRRQRDHILSREEEELLSLTNSVAGSIVSTFRMLTNADFDWDNILDENNEKIEMSPGRYGLFMASPDRRVRHDAYMELYVPFEKHMNTLTSLFTMNLKAHVFYMRAREYDSTLESALSGPNIPVEVYHSLIRSVNDNLDPLQRWAAIKKKVLDVEQLYPYDTYAPLFPEVSKDYTWEEAKSIVKEALKPLGPKVQDILDEAFENRWIDVYENVGKRGGAYCSGTYGVHPYILLNFDGTLSGVSYLAHELGHAIHTYLTNETQPYIYSGYSNFLAEVASTTNEALLMDYLLKKAGSDAERLSLLQEYIQRFGSTFYRQTRFAEFELAAHEETEKDAPLTHEVLNRMFGEMYQKYWGPDMVVVDQERLSWTRIPHFYFNYYVYSYSTAFAASQLMASRILKEGQPAVDEYLDFLSSGSSDYPVELLKIAGVDMSTPTPFEATANRMDGLLDQVEEIIARGVR